MQLCKKQRKTQPQRQAQIHFWHFQPAQPGLLDIKPPRQKPERHSSRQVTLAMSPIKKS